MTGRGVCLQIPQIPPRLDFCRAAVLLLVAGTDDIIVADAAVFGRVVSEGLNAFKKLRFGREAVFHFKKVGVQPFQRHQIHFNVVVVFPEIEILPAIAVVPVFHQFNNG